MSRCGYFPWLLSVVLQTLAHAAIEFLVEPQSSVVVLGRDLTLNCQAADPESSSTSLRYEWTFGNSTVQDDYVFTNHSLFVPSVRPADLGVYQCIVKVVGGSEVIYSRLATVIETYLLDFAIEPRGAVNATEGDAVVLGCVTGRGAPAPALRWQRDGRPYEGAGRQTVASFGDGGGGGGRTLGGQRSATLRLGAVSDADEGVYRCAATNPLSGEVRLSGEARVTVTGMPRAPSPSHPTPSALLLTAGTDHTLACPLTGYPTPERRWYRDGQRLDARLTAANGSRLLTPVGRADAGVYVCVANNSEGTGETPPLNLTVAYLAVQFAEWPRDVVVTAGRPLRLPCVAPASVPPASISWYRSNAPLVERREAGEPSVTVAPDGGLCFSSVQLADAGEYVCVAYNGRSLPTTRAAPTARVTVQASPVLVEPPISKTLLKGSLLRLTCGVNGAPQPSVTWTVDGRPVTADHRTSFRKLGQELIIADITKADEGTYTCRASNSLGSILSAGATITVIVAPEITEPAADIVAVDGSSVTLKCRVYGSPQPDVHWYKDGVSVPDSGRRHHTEAGLVLSRLLGSDSGLYRCVVSNAGGELASEARLTVHVRPKLTSFSQDLRLNQSDSTFLYCEASGAPQPNISWLFEGSANLPQGVSLIDSRTLNIHTVMPAHAGTYTCVARNIVGETNDSLQLFVQVAPTIHDVTGASVVDVGATVRLTCVVSGVPAPAVTWRRARRRLVPTPDLRVSFPDARSVAVRYATRDDGGTYRCRAENAAGTVTLDQTVFIVEKPFPPSLLAAESTSSTSVRLSWQPSPQSRHTEVDYFIVQYKPKSALVFKTHRDDVPPTTTSVSVGGLSPASEYVFKMAARNHLGTGAYSGVRVAVTWNTAPTAPLALTVLSHNATAVRLQWEEPAERNGPIRTYEVLHRIKFTQDDFDLVAIEVPTLPLQRFTQSGLRPFTTYEFKVRAATIEGGRSLWSVYTAVLTATTAGAVASASPHTVRLVVLSSRSIQVSWQPIARDDENAPLRGYTVQYRRAGTTLYAETTVAADSHQVALSGLLPWRYYAVRVLVVNAVGRGPASSEQTARTSAEVPTGSPREVTVDALSSTSLDVHWKNVAEDKRNSELSGYVVQYTGNGEANSHYVGTADTLHTIIKELEVWTDYEIRVQAFTTQVTDGFGPFSGTVTQRTMPAIPGAVGNLTAELDVSFILLSWSAPQRPNGEILLYQLTSTLVNVSDVPSRAKREADIASLSLNLTTGSLSVNLTAGSLSANVSGLRPLMTYEMSIRAGTVAGWGGAATLTRTTLAPQVAVEPITPTAIVLPTDVEVATELETDPPAAPGGGAWGLSREELVGVVVGSVLFLLLLFILLALLLLFFCRRRRQRRRQKHVQIFIPSTISDGDIADNHLATSTSNLMELRHPARSPLPPPSRGDAAFSWSHGAGGVSGGAPSSRRLPVRSTATPASRWQQRGSSAAASSPADSSLYAESLSPRQLELDVVALRRANTRPTADMSLCVPQSYTEHGLINPMYQGTESSNILPAGVNTVIRNRMKRDNAAAIAVQKTQENTLYRDTDELIGQQSVVIFNERTAL